MSTAPVITIFVRHSSDCKCKGDEFSKRRQGRKHLRWTQNRAQYLKATGSRSWAKAEQVKRGTEDQLSGRTPETKAEGHGVQESIDLFIQDKTVKGVTVDVLKQALNGMFETDRSAARGLMAPVRCIAFRHKAPCGNARADQLFSQVTAASLPEVEEQGRPPRSSADYSIKLSGELPEGVTQEEWVVPF